MRLLRTYPPETDESPLGYYRRLSWDNCLSGWIELAQIVEVSRSRTGLLGRPDYVAQALGLEPDWTQQVANREASLRALQRFQRGQIDAICPQCLSESPHLRIGWEHVYVTACPSHKCRLIDRCEHCDARLSSRRESIVHCECGRDLRTARQVPASRSQLWLSATLAGEHRSNLKFGPKLVAAKTLPLTKLIQVFCQMAKVDTKPARRNAAMPKTVAEAEEFLLPLEDLLAEWPTAFEAHVLHRLKVGDPCARTLNTALGHWYRQVKKQSASCSALPFLEIVTRVAAAHFPGLIGLDAAGTKGIEVDKPMSVREVATRLGTGKDFVIAAIDAKVIEGRAIRFGERRLMYRVQHGEVERVHAARTGWVREEEACRHLDVSPAVLGQLVAAEVLTVDRHWREDILKGGPISLISLEAIEVALRSTVGSKEPAIDVIALRDLTSRRVGDKRALQSAFQAIFSGRLRRVGALPAKGIGAIKFRMAEVREFFSTPTLEAGLTVERLESLSGWKSESIYNWIEQGLLQAQSVMLRGQRCRVVLPEHLIQFMRTYIPLTDVARALGTRSSGAARQLAGVAFVGAKLLPNGATRGALVQMTDLARLAATSKGVERS
ncbi:MAG: TniQ family protein [Burkholderiales bacterium]|nr:TniQ family protein [Burkholderiales bacterium]